MSKVEDRRRNLIKELLRSERERQAAEKELLAANIEERKPKLTPPYHYYEQADERYKASGVRRLRPTRTGGNGGGIVTWFLINAPGF